MSRVRLRVWRHEVGKESESYTIDADPESPVGILFSMERTTEVIIRQGPCITISYMKEPQP